MGVPPVAHDYYYIPEFKKVTFSIQVKLTKEGSQPKVNEINTTDDGHVHKHISYKQDMKFKKNFRQLKWLTFNLFI